MNENFSLCLVSENDGSTNAPTCFALRDRQILGRRLARGILLITIAIVPFDTKISIGGAAARTARRISAGIRCIFPVALRPKLKPIQISMGSARFTCSSSVRQALHQLNLRLSLLCPLCFGLVRGLLARKVGHSSQCCVSQCSRQIYPQGAVGLGPYV